MDSERHYSRGKTTPSLAGGGVTSVRHESPERSWMDVLSFVSRPAWSLLQRYLPGNSLSAAQPHNQLWDTESLEHKIGFGHKLTRLEDTRSNLQPQFLHCEHVDSELRPSVEVEAMTWLTADSLSEIGIQNIADKGTSQSTSGYLSVARNFLSQFFMLNVVSTQEVKRSSQNLLAHGAASDGTGSCASVLSWTRETTVVAGTSDSNLHSSSLCHLAERTTMASVAKPTGLFVHCDDRSSKHSESAGHCCHKAASDNDSLHMLRPVSLQREQELRDQANAVSLLGDISAGCASSEVVLLTPEQDNGYSSLEEELSNSRPPSMRRAGEEQLLVGDSESGKETQQQSPTEQEPEPESDTQVQQAEEVCEESKQQEDDQTGAEQAEVSAAPEEQREVAESSQVSPCRNKAIAYIMGSPCSDDSSSGEDSDEDSDDDEDDDDDGFNSEGSSCLSDSDSSEEEDEEDGDYDEESDGEEFDAETERLWNSLCQNRDPYNPRNFTASISTARPISQAAAPESSPASLLSSSPLSASPLSASPLSTSPFSPSPLSTSPLSGPEGSSGSGEEADEAESLKLWDSFSCSLDPYNPFNFQAPLRTRLPPTGSSGKACSVPRYQREQAEERQDSGFGDETPAPPTSALPCRKLRKVSYKPQTVNIVW